MRSEKHCGYCGTKHGPQGPTEMCSTPYDAYEGDGYQEGYRAGLADAEKLIKKHFNVYESESILEAIRALASKSGERKRMGQKGGERG